jgi:hypothetical protein
LSGAANVAAGYWSLGKNEIADNYMALTRRAAEFDADLR